MEELDQILNKLEDMEKRIESLEKSNPEKRNKPILHNNTIQPEDMEVGRMAFVGRYVSEDGTMSSIFGADNNRISSLFQCNSFEMARVIDAFSSEERIDIVKELIQRSSTAKQLMEKFNYPTTGKLYHHLSFLEKIGVIAKNDGYYHVCAKYISCVLLIFSGVAKIIKNAEEKNFN